MPYDNWTDRMLGIEEELEEASDRNPSLGLAIAVLVSVVLWVGILWVVL